MKKFVSLVLALILCASLSVPAWAAEFTDVPAEHAFHDAILDCSEKGIVGGYDDRTFRPANTVTKSNFAVMLSRAFYSETIAKYDDDYNRVTYGPFAGNYLALYYAGAFDDASFYEDFVMLRLDFMNTGINRYDMAQLVANIMKNSGFTADASQKSAAQVQIADYSAIPDQYKDAVATVYALGIIGGYSNGAFRGDGIMNRGQAAVAIYRLAQSVSEGSGILPEASVNAPESPAGPVSSENAPNAEMPTGRTLSNGKAITKANVTEILDQLKAKYPTGTDFAKGYAGLNSDRNPYSNCIAQIVNTYRTSNNLRCSTRTGCGGWAAFVEDSIFGQNATFRKTTFDKVRPGDLVIQMNSKGLLTHVSVVQSEAVINPYAIHYGKGAKTPVSNDELDYYVTWRHTTTDAGTDREGVYHLSWDNVYEWTIDKRNPVVMFGDSSSMGILYDYYTAYPD